jgi:hypothetical protein
MVTTMAKIERTVVESPKAIATAASVDIAIIPELLACYSERIYSYEIAIITHAL